MNKELQQLNIGILGGGQLGRMLLQEATNWDLKIAVLDPAKDAPCANMTHEFVQGDFKDFDTVYQFGKGRDIITIEFEDVNADALEKLEKEGVKVFPQPRVLKIIKDKGAQKTFYTDHSIPTAPYKLVENAAEIKGCGIEFPFFQKMRKGGYDGYGVKKISSENEVGQAFDAPSVIEQQADLYKELSVIVARNEKGEVKTFPVVDMEFNPESNMVQFLFAPAEITDGIEKRAVDIAKMVIEKLEMVGLLAVELFLTKQGEIWVNEIAPRPHNSGHHTIEANVCSQYEQHLRAISDLPLGDTTTLSASVMVNLLGEKEYTGTPHYEGFNQLMQMSGVYVHLYGKGQTKPFRKMGHVTIVDESMEKAKEKAMEVKRMMKVKLKT
jgi:5-(carboxyamino)imidazole ribonucleotide synthase